MGDQIRITPDAARSLDAWYAAATLPGPARYERDRGNAG
jgi:hypothetical protein